MAFNKNELVLDRVRSLTAHDLSTNEILFRLTQLEEPSLTCTAEGEQVTDAVGALITTMYRAKQATFSATNSLFSLDLAASQYGTKKVQGNTGSEIVDYTYDILTFTENDAAEGVALSKTPANANEIKFAYEIVDGGIGKSFRAGAAASATDFQVSTNKIIPPTDFTGKLFVEYTYKNENAAMVRNTASEFPEACSVIVYAYFRDVCNENIVYSGKIIIPKAKLNPESIEIALTSTGKHPFEFTVNKDYCAEEGEDTLFEIIVSQ